MKKFYFKMTKVNLIAYSVFLILLILSFSSNPPNGNTGAPGDGLCTGCHSPNLSIDGNVTITGLPAEVEPGQSYNLTITSTYTQGNAVRTGFQLVALDENNNNIGSFSNAGPNVDFESGGGRTYAEHRPAQFFGSGNSVDFTFTWTAPNQPTTENITFYVASLLANGSGSSGDRTVTNTAQTTIQNEQPEDLLISLSSQNASCFGAEDGNIFSSVTGGVEPYSYLWSDGSTQSNITLSPAGNYFLTVTDSNGTQAIASEIISEPDDLMVTFETSGTITCDQNAVTVNALSSGGTQPYSFAWSDGTSGSVLITESAGLYFLTLSDANDCTSIFSTEILEDNETIPIELESEIQQICFGDTLIIQANGPTGNNYNYLWTTIDGNIISFDNLGQLTADRKGTYSLTISNSFNGCFSEAQIVINGSDQNLSLNFSAISPSCFGESDGSLLAEGIGGTFPYSIIWSTGENTPQLNNISAGTYTITLSDNIGCTLIQTFELDDKEPIALQFEIQDLSGPEENDASITVQVSGGNPPYSYQWQDSNSQEATLQNLSAGTYTVTVTDSLQCSIIGNAVINPFGCNLQVSIGILDSILCHGDPNGSLNLTIEGENAPFQIIWSTGSQSNTISGLTSGLYSASVTDNVGCEKVVQIDLMQPELLTINFEIQNTSTQGANDGMVLAQVQGGTPPYTYLWKDQEETGNALEMLFPGTYFLTVTDINGCTIEGDAEVKGFECSLEVTSINIEEVSCFGEADGKVLLEVNSETEINSIIWSNGLQGLSNENLPAGNYSVTITDEKDCQVEVEFSIGEPEELNAVIESFSPFILTPFTGFIEVSVTGGTSPYNYQWSVDGVNLPQNIAFLDQLNNGKYEVIITDSNGCSFVLSGIEIQLQTSFNEPVQENLQLYLYPNPAEDILILQSSEPLGAGQEVVLQIVNDKGIQIRIQNTILRDKIYLDIKNIPSGNYILMIYREGQWQTSLKWIKN